ADRAVERLARDVEAQARAVDPDHGEADAAVGDAVADDDVGEVEAAAVDGQADAVRERGDAFDAAAGGHYARKHERPAGIGKRRIVGEKARESRPWSDRAGALSCRGRGRAPRRTAPPS